MLASLDVVETADFVKSLTQKQHHHDAIVQEKVKGRNLLRKYNLGIELFSGLLTKLGIEEEGDVSRITEAVAEDVAGKNSQASSELKFDNTKEGKEVMLFKLVECRWSYSKQGPEISPLVWV